MSRGYFGFETHMTLQKLTVDHHHLPNGPRSLTAAKKSLLIRPIPDICVMVSLSYTFYSAEKRIHVRVRYRTGCSLQKRRRNLIFRRVL